MIRKLKARFICLAMASLCIVLAVSVLGINAINYSTIIQDADSVLVFLSKNRGMFPEMNPDKPGEMEIPRHFSPETPYETRYFSVLMDETGQVIHNEISRIISVDSEQANSYAETVFRSGKRAGFADGYRYLQNREGDGIRIIFLDCSQKLDAFYNYLWISIGMTLAGLAVMFLVILFFAGKIVRPMAESYEKQKQFITDAGHEIKTPLTIINANIDLLEIDPEDGDCLQDIRQQTERLTALTNDLVYLARMSEDEPSLEMTAFSVSKAISDTVTAFNAIALTQNKELVCEIQPEVMMAGNEKAIRQLVSLLMDNALKYSPEGSTVEIHFSRRKRAVQLTIYNTTKEAVSNEELERVFDRFYRTDKSRNSQTGGHGIGLSIAKAIAEAHHGKIHAWTRDGHSFNVTCIFPI